MAVSRSVSRFSAIGLITLGVELVLLSQLSGWRIAGASLLIWALFCLPGVLYITRLRNFNLNTIVAGALLGAAASVFFIALIGSVFDYFGPALFFPVPVLLSLFAVWRIKSHKDDVFGITPGDESDILGAAIPVWITLLLIALPLFSVGVLVFDRHIYAPFFCADFFKHMAHTHSLALGSLPPIDLFTSSGSLHYYWFYYVIPSSIMSLLQPSAQADSVLIASGLIETNLFIVVVYSVCRQFGAKRITSSVAVSLAMLSLSLDGLASLLLFPDVPFATSSQAVNMEALDITSVFGATHAIFGSTFFRLCLYVPQHQLAVALLALLMVLYSNHTKLKVTDRIARGVVVAALPCISLLFGAVAIGAILAVRGYIWLVHKEKPFPVFTILAAIVAAGLILSLNIMVLNQATSLMNSNQSAAGEMSLPNRLLLIIPQLISTFGLVFVLGVPGLLLLKRRTGQPLFARNAPWVFLVIGLLSYVVTEIVLDPGKLQVDVQLKTSFFLIFVAVLGTSFLFSSMGQMSKPRRIAIWVVILVLGLPGGISTINDVKWHSVLLWDFNLPFSQSVSVPSAEMEALDWIRQNTDPHSVFVEPWREDYFNGGSDAWVPVFGGRAILIGRRGTNKTPELFQINQRIFGCLNGIEAHRLCREAKVAYIYNSHYESSGRGPAVDAVLSRHTDLFERAFQNGLVTVWRVREPLKK